MPMDMFTPNSVMLLMWIAAITDSSNTQSESSHILSDIQWSLCHLYEPISFCIKLPSNASAVYVCKQLC